MYSLKLQNITKPGKDRDIQAQEVLRILKPHDKTRTPAWHIKPQDIKTTIEGIHEGL